MSTLVPVVDLAKLLKITIAPDDSYANMIVEQASNAVRDAARHPEWVLSAPQTGEALAPQTARDIALWVARRAYTHPGNLSRRTAGPISESYFENGVEALELTESELKRLNFLVGSSTGGLWVQPISSGYVGRYPLTVPSDMDPPGDSFIIADSDQFPYALSEDPPPVVGDVNYVP